MPKNTKTSKYLIIVPILTFVIGAMIFIYPALSNYLAELNQKEIISVYDKNVVALNDEKLQYEWDKAYKYNENLAGDPVHDPFVYGSGYALPDNYNDVLNINKDGVMAYLSIPKISVDLPVYHGTSDDVLNKAAGHIEGSALPIGIKGLTSFISAHRGLPSSTLFTHLDKLEIGDKFYVKVLDKTIVYGVYKTEELKPEDIQYITNDNDKETLILLTCTPYGINTHRLLVYGEKIEMIENETEIQDEQEFKEPDWLVNYLFSIALGIVILIICIIVYNYFIKKKHK